MKDQTSSLIDGMTMVNMDVSEFMTMTKYNVSLYAFYHLARIMEMIRRRRGL